MLVFNYKCDVNINEWLASISFNYKSLKFFSSFDIITNCDSNLNCHKVICRNVAIINLTSLPYPLMNFRGLFIDHNEFKYNFKDRSLYQFVEIILKANNCIQCTKFLVFYMFSLAINYLSSKFLLNVNFSLENVKI